MGAFSPVHWLIVIALVAVPSWLLWRARQAPLPQMVRAAPRRATSSSRIDDPYAPPAADDDESPASESIRLAIASQGARFLNSVFDTFVIAVVARRASPVEYWLITAGYFWSLETFFGVSIGKLLTGTRVVTVDGYRATAWQILGRTLIRFIPIEAFSFMSSNPVGWHDRWSNTRVVPR